MTIQDTSLSSDAFTALRNVIVSGVPSVPVYATYNDKLISKPQIVIQPFSISEELDRFNTIEGKKFLTGVVDVYASTGLLCDSTADKVRYAVKSNVPDGLQLIDYNEDADYSEEGGRKFFLKTFSFNFLRD